VPFSQHRTYAHLQTKDRSFTGDPSSAKPHELQEEERDADEQQDNESFSLSISSFRSGFDSWWQSSFSQTPVIGDISGKIKEVHLLRNTVLFYFGYSFKEVWSKDFWKGSPTDSWCLLFTSSFFPFAH